ncbi:MAG: cofactor-independent phosphoglycerate mutase [Thermoguttaceae bacterium]|nr:cofactor-independent phosphoglycerate mutase [Thermoguttaceae bacterium]
MSVYKRVVLIPDGFADDPIPAVNGKTPMEAASTPTLDSLAPRAAIGRSFNVPDGMTPGSDVATLSVLGYDPSESYTGRAPLEAAAQHLELGPNDWAFRCNLVCVEDGAMRDFSAGHISTEEATALLAEINADVAPRWAEIAPEIGGTVEFFPGVAYRNLMIFRPDADSDATAAPFDASTQTAPPHDYADRSILDVLPQGKGGAALRRLMALCAERLAASETNKRRIAAGKLPATQCWLWGQGTRPRLAPFAEKYGFGPGAMITAVDLLRGIARNLDWEILEVPGATGYVDTDFAAKGRAAAEALDRFDVVCVHVEAPDEAGHEGSVEKKVASLEAIDRLTLPPILEKLRTFENWRLLISPDHPTPVAIKTHSRGAVPWAIVGSDVAGDGFATYDETTGAASTRVFERGADLAELFLKGNLQ